MAKGTGMAKSAETQVKESSLAGGVAILDEDALRGKIHEVRGQKVMLDFELAEVYGYTTKAFNQQVQRNIEKFDDDFRFQLTQSEWEILRSQNVTSSWGGTRYLPYAFSESGIYMLMTVLKGDLATRQSKALIRLFKQMKDAVEEGRGLVGRREFLDLSLRLNDSLSEGLRLRRDLGWWKTFPPCGRLWGGRGYGAARSAGTAPEGRATDCGSAFTALRPGRRWALWRREKSRSAN